MPKVISVRSTVFVPCLTRPKLLQQVRSLQHLLHLDLSENKLTSFATDLTILRALRFLNLSKNEINEMPGWCLSIGSIYVSDIYLDDFGEMVSLRALNLSHNQIECLPSKKVLVDWIRTI